MSVFPTQCLNCDQPCQHVQCADCGTFFLSHLECPKCSQTEAKVNSHSLRNDNQCINCDQPCIHVQCTDCGTFFFNDIECPKCDQTAI